MVLPSLIESILSYTQACIIAMVQISEKQKSQYALAVKTAEQLALNSSAHLSLPRNVLGSLCSASSKRRPNLVSQGCYTQKHLIVYS